MNPAVQQHQLTATPAQIRYLDGMRGLAALYVMIGHCRFLLWEGYQSYAMHPAEYSRTSKLLMYGLSAFRFGHEAVMFFFVLSGFVIHLKYAKGIKRDSQLAFNFPDYLKRRTERLYPPMLLALLLTFVLDSTGRRLGYHIYLGTTGYPLIDALNKDRSFTTLLGNLAWLQRVFVPEFGTNGPLWSLMFEWWFYMLYPLFFFLNRKSMGLTAALVILLCALTFRVHIPLLSIVLQSFPFWYLGVILADIFAGRINLNNWLPSVLVLLIPTILLLAKTVGTGFLGSLCWALGFAGLLYSMQLLFKRGWQFTWLVHLKWLGDCSYSLYVMHFPTLAFLSGWLMWTHGEKLPISQLYIFAGIALTVTFAYLVHFAVERPFTKRRKTVAADVSKPAIHA